MVIFPDYQFQRVIVYKNLNLAWTCSFSVFFNQFEPVLIDSVKSTYKHMESDTKNKKNADFLIRRYKSSLSFNEIQLRILTKT
jgi:hypothetical protein